jgi:hypothetical protein
LIENALARPDITLLVFTKALADEAWNRWRVKANVILVTERRCSLKSEVGSGHPNLWEFERIAKEV